MTIRRCLEHIGTVVEYDPLLTANRCPLCHAIVTVDDSETSWDGVDLDKLADSLADEIDVDVSVETVHLSTDCLKHAIEKAMNGQKR